MARLTDHARARNVTAVRAAMERLLAGDLPPGGTCDLKTLATLAGVNRTGFYPRAGRDGTPRPGAYQHLAEEFERRRRELQDAGAVLDPRAVQITRLKQEVATLKNRVVDREQKLAQLEQFKTLAVSRLVAQHDEIERLRHQIAQTTNVRPLTVAAADYRIK